LDLTPELYPPIVNLLSVPTARMVGSAPVVYCKPVSYVCVVVPDQSAILLASPVPKPVSAVVMVAQFASPSLVIDFKNLPAC